jgi:hypothetical protein
MELFSKKYCSLLLLMLVMVGCFVIIHLRNRNIKLREDNNKNIDLAKMVIEEMYFTQKMEWLLEEQILCNSNIIDCKGKKQYLFDYLNDDMFVFYVSSDMCESCVSKELKRLDKLIKNIGDNNVLVVLKNYRKNFVEKDSLFKRYDKVCISKEELFDSSNLLQTPIIFRVGANYELDQVYCSSKVNDNSFNDFLDVIQNR